MPCRDDNLEITHCIRLYHFHRHDIVSFTPQRKSVFDATEVRVRYNSGYTNHPLFTTWAQRCMVIIWRQSVCASVSCILPLCCCVALLHARATRLYSVVLKSLLWCFCCVHYAWTFVCLAWFYCQLYQCTTFPSWKLISCWVCFRELI